MHLVFPLLLVLIPIHKQPAESIVMEFKFKSMWLGKPPLKVYRYDIKFANNTDKTWYIVMPNYLDHPLENNKTVDGAQIDSYGEARSYRFFRPVAGSFSVFTLAAKQTVNVKDFEFEIFSDEILEKSTWDIDIMICEKIRIDDRSVEEYMSKKDQYSLKEAAYSFENPEARKITLDLK